MRRRVSENCDGEIELEMIRNRSSDMPTVHHDRVISEGDTSTPGSLASFASNETRTPPFDLLTILVPITDTCLILYAIIILLALGIVACVVILAIFHKYLPESELLKYYEI